jgi:hypothetical protein
VKLRVVCPSSGWVGSGHGGMFEEVDEAVDRLQMGNKGRQVDSLAEGVFQRV